jgi:hypothetical protein
MNTRWRALAVLLLSTFPGISAVFGQAVSQGSGDPVLGIWRWNGGALVTVGPKSLSSSEAKTGEWKILRTEGGERVYQFRWDQGGWIDTLTLTNDSNKLTGRNNVGDRITGERIQGLKPSSPAEQKNRAGKTQAGAAGASDPLEGKWHYFNDHVVTIHPGGIVTSSKGVTGKWVYLKNPEVERKYRIQWDANLFVDTITLSRDGKKLEGKNNKGDRVGATRVPALTD